MITCNNQVTDIQQQSLDSLYRRCKEADNGLPTFYPNIMSQKRDTDNNIFYYVNDNLVGFLSVYFFYQNGCEISLIVDPDHREKGIASQLLMAVRPLLLAREINYLLFSTGSTQGKHWLSKKGFKYEKTESHMQRNGFKLELINMPSLTIRHATVGDLAVLCAIDIVCFKENHPNMYVRFMNILSDNEYTVYLAMYNDVPVGKAHIRWEEHQATFSDIAIMPNYQRRGLGKELLAYCINQSLSAGKSSLALDVESHNRTALNLYLKQGFKITYEHDFWFITFKDLDDWLQYTGNRRVIRQNS